MFLLTQSFTNVLLYINAVEYSAPVTAQEMKFQLMIFSVNVTNSAGNSGFGHFYRRSP